MRVRRLLRSLPLAARCRRSRFFCFLDRLRGPSVAGTSLPCFSATALLTPTLSATARAEAPPPDYAVIIAAPERTDADRKNDARREAVKLLAFTGVLPGWKVIDMAAGAGYSTELMARGAAPGGVVYAQNPPEMRPAAKTDMAERMQRPAMKDVVPDIR